MKITWYIHVHVSLVLVTNRNKISNSAKWSDVIINEFLHEFIYSTKQRIAIGPVKLHCTSQNISGGSSLGKRGPQLIVNANLN